MPPLTDHPLRYVLANELHARPFPSIAAASQAAYLAMKPAGPSDKAAERAHLIDLLDRFGAAHPQPDATHYSGTLGRFILKWESHTEFVTYTIFSKGTDKVAFSPDAFAVFPDDWLSSAPGERITLVAAVFRIDSAGHMRLAIFSRPDVGPQRIGRVIQRLCEIETYKAMAMLGLNSAREMSPQMTQVDDTLSSLLSHMADGTTDPADILAQLLDVSSQIEHMGAQAGYRFAATEAYAKIVNQRIEVLREDRFAGRQTFGEFMMRRFDPAMRTVTATQRRLQVMSDRALRAGELLRTKVDVERSAQNQALLTSMDRRADLQMRLQKTVEGLSVVAVSYYAVNIVLYLIGPLGPAFGISKTLIAAAITPVVMVTMWLFLRRLRRNLE